MTDHDLTTEPSVGAPEGGEIHVRLIVTAMCLAVVLVIAGVSSMTIALPTIGLELGASQSELQWIIDVFALAVAALLLPAGALGDRYGRKLMMLIGFALFIGSFFWAATIDSVGWLIAARGVGGVGAALIFPGTLSTLTGALPQENRGQAIGLWVASASLGGMIGSLAAGFLLEWFWFGSIFVAMGLVAIVVALITARFVPETRDPGHASLDPVGAVLSVVGIGALVFGITEGPVKGWTDPLTVTGFVVGAAGLIAFCLYELRVTHPLLDVRLFGLRGFRTGTLSIFAQFFAIFGFFYTAGLMLGFSWGYSPLQMGLAFLPLSVLLPWLSTKAPEWSHRWGRGLIGGIGLAALAVAFVVLALVEADSSYLLFAGGLLVFGAGMGLAGPPATESIIEALPPAKQGVASAMNDVARELGGALGIAVLGTVMTAGYRSSIDDASDQLPPETVDAVRDSAGAGLGAASQAGESAAPIIEVIERAVSAGFSNSMWIAAALMAAVAAYIGLRTPTTAPDRADSERSVA